MFCLASHFKKMSLLAEIDIDIDKSVISIIEANQSGNSKRCLYFRNKANMIL